jgi:hypothetical protein
MKAAQAKALCAAFRPGSGSKVAECPLWADSVEKLGEVAQERNV